MNKTVQCKECGTEYNRSLTYCPECGYSTKKYVNKRFIAFVIVYVFLVLIMLGWGAYLYLNHKQLHEKAELQEKTEQRKKEAKHKQALKDDEYVSKIKEERAKALNEIEIAYRNSEREYLERINAEYQNESKQYSNKVTFSTDVTITKNDESSSQTPKIYSADSFINAVSSAQIYNSEGGRLNMKHNGLWIGGSMVSGFAPRVVSFNSVGGVLKYETPDSHTITFMVDFSEKMVIGKVSGGSKNMYFTIR